MKNLTFFLMSLFSLLSSAQVCTYLAYDGFDYPAGSTLHNASGSAGWSNPWNVQGENSNMDGYKISADGSINYLSLQNYGNQLIGGESYLISGRSFNITTSGPFASYIQEGGQIGSLNTGTLYVSGLINKLVDNQEDVYFTLHNQQIPWWIGGSNRSLGLGYFGEASENDGQKFWSVNLNGDIQRSNVPLVVGTPVFYVASIHFRSDLTEINVWINPTELGTLETIPNLTLQVDQFNFRSLATYLGHNQNNGAFDEFRMASRIECVIPDSSIEVNMPPNAIISQNVFQGQSPLTVQFSAHNSYDPENGELTYEWNFGDGSARQNGAEVSHVYTNLGNLRASLTVTDNMNLRHTSYVTITVLDQNNSFPCLTSISSLKRPNCIDNDGRIRINTSGSFELRNQSGELMTITNSNEYHGLAPGVYQLNVEGDTGCVDQMDVHVQVDRSLCEGWNPELSDMKIGTNLNRIADWNTERPFKNRLKNTRSNFIPYTDACECWGLDQLLAEIPVDDNGYPLVIPYNSSLGSAKVKFFLSSANANLQPGQTYVLLYEGDGEIEMLGSAIDIQSSPGRIQFGVKEDGTTWFSLNRSSESNRVRNIRVLLLSEENDDLVANPFNPSFISKASPFQFYRFLDWGLATELSPMQVSEWSGRTPVDQFTYATKTGVPFEIMIQLCNMTQRGAWINVPHLVNDDFIRQMAQFFKDNLNNDLPIYLEYSNEVWNWIYPQAHYNDQNKPSNLSYPRAYAEKAKHTFDIWMEVFNNESHRVKRVLGLQAGYNSLNEEITSHIPADSWDIGAATHYFSLEHGPEGNPVLNVNSTVQDIMANARNNFNNFMPAMKNDYDIVSLHGKEMATYEGGQHFVGNVFGIPYDYQQAMWDSQNSLEMYNMYNEVFNNIRRWGCVAATNYTLAGTQENIYGSWGSMEHIDVAEPYLNSAPKYQALLDNISEEPTLSSEIISDNEPMKSLGNNEPIFYPNPNSGIFYLSSKKSEPYHVEIYNLDGRRILEKFVQDKTPINISEYSSGLYILKLRKQDEEVLTAKIIKQ